VKKFLKAVGILVVVFIIFISGLLYWSASETDELTAEVTPFIETSMPLVTTWDVDKFKHLVSPEGLASFESEKGRRIIAYVSKVGSLKSFDKPIFVKSTSTASTSGKGRTIATFTVKARFENGDGVLTFTLVRTGSSYLILGINLSSDIFLEE